jgi:hypothetical protein
MTESSSANQQMYNGKLISYTMQTIDELAHKQVMILIERNWLKANRNEHQNAARLQEELKGFYYNDLFWEQSVAPRKFIAFMLSWWASIWAVEHNLGEIEPGELTIKGNPKWELVHGRGVASDVVGLVIIRGDQVYEVLQGELVMGRGEGAKNAWEEMVLKLADEYAATMLNDNI